MFCAVNDGKVVRTSEIARTCNASLNHLLQVVAVLQDNGFIEALRGRAGGVRLARSMDRISIGQVFRALETTVPIAECFDPKSNTCPLLDACRLRSYISKALDAFYHELDMVTLMDLVKGNCELNLIMSIDHPRDTLCVNSKNS
jgi:Rrf2 family transcriptional regulator, nitric oxide-sensitive transcriptional repressor